MTLFMGSSSFMKEVIYIWNILGRNCLIIREYYKNLSIT
ncbi:hypothetical protein QGO_1662 [Clostridioides difficile CD212]|nr:hypothetical protein QCA_1892 [Clostridioides difficile CD40]EQF75809.1 hypothetical protein QGO_1662 [Clostridioides difficile CD212]EQI63048.1 hypothetical protein QQ7_1670 [Clostridioides difficile Y307]EQI81172.1 hypothetical protein QQK_1638 [Clostridioides difficile P1]EQJ72870.1 hypothetical protein QSY_1795 [Clostridioides difficile P36]EQK79040.1 hypothetical protein QE7_1674 [Clostridioides difficile CD92]